MRVQWNKSVDEIEFIYFIKFNNNNLAGPYIRKPYKYMLRNGELIIRKIQKDEKDMAL
jgi:hypothetical protein